MEDTGLMRKVDSFGRVSLPLLVMKQLGLHVNDRIEIWVDGDDVVLKKYDPTREHGTSYEGILLGRGTT